MLFTAPPSADNAALRNAIYSGHIFKIPASTTSLAIVAHCTQALENAFGTSLDTAHNALTQDELMSGIGNARRQVLKDPATLAHIRELMRVCGFTSGENAFDPLRLRAVFSGGHHRPEAERAYAMHRDTWFANPQCQINWWMPLHDVTEETSFSFYPDYFDKPLRNTSQDFDYGEWMSAVGWQGSNGSGHVDYPRALEKPAGNGVSFACRKGEVILFSAAHLHQTNPHDGGRSRFSVDFRSVHAADLMKGKGAPNADNGSTAEAVLDYVS